MTDLATATAVLLPAGTWTIDPSHSSIEFVARHLMVTKVRGQFQTFRGTITASEQPEQSSVEVEIEAASIDTREPQRDQHLRSPDFLDAASYPNLTFRSTSVRPGREDHWIVTGDLTIRGVTRRVELDVEFAGVVDDPWGNQRAGFSAVTEIDRNEFGATWNVALETGGVVVGKKVRVELEIEAIRA